MSGEGAALPQLQIYTWGTIPYCHYQYVLQLQVMLPVYTQYSTSIYIPYTNISIGGSLATGSTEA